MRRTRTLKAVLAAVACLGMILPTPALQAAVTTGSPQPRVAEAEPARIDVALSQEGVLQGRVVDGAGMPLGGMPVSLRNSHGAVAKTTTDASGRFFTGRLRSGTYEIVAGPARGVYRVWAPKLAPPSAQEVATVRVVRGQQSPLCQFLGNPWVIVGIIATAVAIPVVIHNTKKPASP